MAKKSGNRLGSWSFLIGLIIAIVFSFIGTLTSGLLIALVVIGIIVGLLNITDEEVTPFLMSGAVLIIASFFGRDVVSIIPTFTRILDALLTLFVPATIIVAIKNVFSLARH